MVNKPSRKPKSSKQLNEIRYQSNYLTEVIVRLDLLSPIDEIHKKLLPRLIKEIKQSYPIPEPQKLISTELQISPEAQFTKEIETIEWIYYGRNRDKMLKIVPNSILVSYKMYRTFEQLKQEFLPVLNTFLDIYQDAQPTRLGLRFVNNLNFSEGNPLEWSDYLNPYLIAAFDFVPEPHETARLFNILELNNGEFNIRYQFGMPNPDYPAPIKQKQFVLDFDAYYQGLLDKAEVHITLDKFHSRIQELFEKSITDNLREKMNGKR